MQKKSGTSAWVDYKVPIDKTVAQIKEHFVRLGECGTFRVFVLSEMATSRCVTFRIKETKGYVCEDLPPDIK